MRWILASERLGEFKDSDIAEWKFFNCDFAKVDGKRANRPLFRKDTRTGKIIFSHKELYGRIELPESEFHRIVWLDEQDEGWVPELRNLINEEIAALSYDGDNWDILHKEAEIKELLKKIQQCIPPATT